MSLIGGTSDIPPDANGYSRLRSGAWRLLLGQFTLLSYHPEVLAQIAPQLRFEKSDNPSQLRAHVADLSGTNLAQWINQQGYKSAARMSQGNERLLALLAEQFRVPDGRCLTVAQTVLAGRLVDPLDGQFELAAVPGGGRQWVSTRAAAGPRAISFRP